MVYVELKDMVLKECEEYIFNDYFIFRNNTKKNGMILSCKHDDNDTYESSHSILKHAIDLAIPEIEILTYCSEGYPIWATRPLLKPKEILNQEKKEIFEITIDKINFIKNWFHILVDYTESTKKNWHNLEGNWNLTFNEYIDATTSLKVEKAYVHLINALEAALSKENTEMKYKVSLYTSLLLTDDKEKRIEAFNLVKKAYDIRNKIRNEIPFSKDEILVKNLYSEFFKLKKIVSTILLKTYTMGKSGVIEKIENAIFECQKVL